MEKIKKILKKCLEFVLPFIVQHKANKVLKEKNKNDDTIFTKNIKELSIDSLKEKYHETYKTKDKFEDKSKTNVVAITIATTMIMGSFGLMTSLHNKYDYAFIKWMIFILLFCAIVYMLVAGILAIRVLFHENIMYDVSIESISKQDEDSKMEYNMAIQKNINQNIIRNNITSASYECVRNAIACIILVFVFVALPI